MLARAAARDGVTIVVSNEVGSGIVPGDARSRLYQDVLGAANSAVATAGGAGVLVRGGAGGGVEVVGGEGGLARGTVLIRIGLIRIGLVEVVDGDGVDGVG